MDRMGSMYFHGVFAADELNKQTVNKFPSCYIANTDPSHKPGTHWVAVYFDEYGKAEFFCSYGKSPKNYNFDAWIEKQAKSWQYHQTKLQGDWSSVCGQYCLVYLLHRLRNISIKDFFSKDCDLNDSWVNDFISTRFNIDTSVSDDHFLLKQIARALTGQF